MRIKTVEKIPENITAVGYNIKLLCANKLVKDQAKNNIDIESEDVVEIDKQTKVAIINDIMSIRYLQDKTFSDFKGKKDKVFIVVRIVGENEQVKK